MNQAGIDGRLIETLVRRVYEHVRRDPLLGPVFEARIEGWETHLQQMFAFCVGSHFGVRIQFA